MPEVNVENVASFKAFLQGTRRSLFVVVTLWQNVKIRAFLLGCIRVCDWDEIGAFFACSLNEPVVI